MTSLRVTIQMKAIVPSLEACIFESCILVCLIFQDNLENCLVKSCNLFQKVWDPVTESNAGKIKVIHLF